MTDVLETPRRWWFDLSDRERRLVALLGAVLAAMVVFLPLIIGLQKASTIASEKDELAAVLRDIARSRERLEERAQARKAAERRYAMKAPDLSAYMEEQGQQVGLSVARTQPQPDAEIGNFTRRSVRVDLPSVPLRPAVELMAAVENSPYPIALEEIQITHNQAGADQFNIRLGVVAFDRHRTAVRGRRAE